MVIKSRFFVRIIQVTLLLVLVGCIPLDTSDYENAWSEEEAIIFDRLPDGGFFPPGTLPCTGETIEGTNVGVVGFQNGYTREYLFHFFDRVVKKDAAYFKNARALDNCVVESAAGLRLKVNPPSQQALVIAGADIPVESFSRRYFLEPDRECRGTLVNGSEVAVYGYSKQSRVFIYKTAEQGNQEGDPRSFSSWQQLVSCLNEGGLPVEIKYVYLPDSSTTLSRREYDTEEEARRYAESQYEAGAVFLQRGFDTPILLEILDAWAPPDELAGWPSGERYFQLSTSKGIKWHRYLEGAIAEANRTPEAVTVKSFKRGKEQKIELEYPNFVPPTIEVRPGVFKEITIVEVYYTVGEYVSQNLNSALTFAKEHREGRLLVGDEVRTMRRGVDIKPPTIIGPCLLPAGLDSDWLASRPYFIGEGEEVAASLFELWGLEGFLTDEFKATEYVRCEEVKVHTSSATGVKVILIFGFGGFVALSLSSRANLQ